MSVPRTSEKNILELAYEKKMRSMNGEDDDVGEAKRKRVIGKFVFLVSLG